MAERGPPQGPDEVLEELDDDAIVAQQATAHSPAPRVRVTDEARTIVVSEPPPDAGDTARMQRPGSGPPSDPGDTAKLQRMERGRNDPTLVLKAVQQPPPSVPLVPPRRSGMPAWLPWLIWGLAGLLAFGFGAFLALRMSSKEARPPPAATAKPANVHR